MGFMDFFTRLFGGAKMQQNPPPPSAANPTQASVGGPDQPEYDDARQEWKETEAMMARFEASGENLATMKVNDPVSFWVNYFAVEDAESQNLTEDQAAQQHGFRNLAHWETARDYFMAKWSELGQDEDGDWEVRQKPDFTNAALQARQQQVQGGVAAAAAANPQLLEPVEGVNVEQWAQVAAGATKLPANSTPAQFAQYLAKFGMDKAKWDRVSAEWTNRMSQDTSMVITTAYSKAFAGGMGVTAGGAEPCTFEKFMEVMVAQEAWSQQGKDVNAQLQTTFGINAATYGAWSAYWSPKMATDVQLIGQYDGLRSRFLQKYSGAGMDGDLSL
ncbi:MAG: hypothetical protein J7M25_15190 [Deltaproteobacteria bacterium]|nr:hypothetical protein [Deltaproteobacteria bacterium]